VRKGYFHNVKTIKIIYIGVQLDVTYLFYLKQLYMFRAFLAHHQEFLYCLVKILFKPQVLIHCRHKHQPTNMSRSQWILLMYSKFTPTCFGKWLPSSEGCRCLRNYSSSVCIVGVYGLRSVQCSQLSWIAIHIRPQYRHCSNSF
jgi:hypothetical protein